MTTLFAVWMAIAAMAPARVTPSDASALFADLVAVGAEENATPDELGLAGTWAVCESAGRVDAIGDSGAAIGRMQLHVEHWDGHTRAEVLADGRLQLALWLRSYRVAVAECGSIAGGLGRVASGKCGGAPKLVARRRKGRC